MPHAVSIRSALRLRTRAVALGLAASGVMAGPLHAESAAMPSDKSQKADTMAYAPVSTAPPDALSQFAPAEDRDRQELDYTYMDEALRWMVIPMGPSIRQGSRRVEGRLGTRLVYGHDSRLRMEGNRVAFSFLTDEIRASLTEYRKDLERLGSELDLTRLPRNEQLAFWLNLHNIALIEALAYEYPLSQPSRESFGSNAAPLDEAKLVSVRGVDLSARDIRERIVYPNWRDPKVIYGFWRGEIGGPSIQRAAFTGKNLDLLLALSGEEFVNSLRGLEHTGKTLRVSEIYREATPYYFETDQSLRDHLKIFARDNVKAIINKTDRTIYNQYERDIADMARGEKDPSLQNLFVNADLQIGGNIPVATRPNAAIQRLMEERREKLNRAIRRGIRTGEVIVGEGGLDDQGEPKEVE